jgi:hypothetical protein
MELRAERVDDDVPRSDVAASVWCLSTKNPVLWFGRERGRPVSLRRPGFERAAFELPFVEPAVEHRDSSRSRAM